MNEDGKKFEVLVEINEYPDRTGVMIPGHSLKVWADANMKSVIESIPGVTNVYNSLTPTEFSVFLDERYDVKFVAAAIEKAILKAGEL